MAFADAALYLGSRLRDHVARHGVFAFVVGDVAFPRAIAVFATAEAGARRSVLIGAEDLWEPADVIWTDDAALEAMAGLLKIGYDEAFERCSPGNLLMRETIKYAAERGLDAYEFLGEESPWTKLWAQDARPIASVRAYPYNFSGLLTFSADAFGRARNRLTARLGRESRSLTHGRTSGHQAAAQTRVKG